MRLKTLELKLEDLENTGLGDFFSTKFNSIIALVGKNGSGKTRYLKAIEKNILSCDITTDFSEKFDKVPQSLLDVREKYLNSKVTFDRINDFYNHQNYFNLNPNDSVAKKNFSKAANLYNHVSSRTENQEYPILSKLVKKEISQRVKIIRPDDLRKLKASFDASKTQSFQDIIDSTLETVEINEISLIADTSLSYLQRLPHKLAFDEIDCRGDMKKFQSRVSYKRFKTLQNLIKEFLGKDLEWHSKSSDVSEHDDHVNIKQQDFAQLITES